MTSVPDGRGELVPQGALDVDNLAPSGGAVSPTSYQLRRIALWQEQVLMREGNALLSDTYVDVNECYREAVGRVIEAKKPTATSRHRQMTETFFDSSSGEYGKGLLRNQRQVEAQVLTVTSTPFPLEPEPPPMQTGYASPGPTLESRRLTFWERLRGEVWLRDGR